MVPLSEPEGSNDRTGWQACEALLDRFEDAWRRGERPAIEDFWPRDHPRGFQALVELARTDLELRLKVGEAARVETYLARFPELARPPAVLDLIAAEYDFRRRREPVLTPAEFSRRFPGHDEALHARLGDGLPPPDERLTVVAPPGAATWGGEKPVTPAPAQTTPPGYEILGELGRGGMGVVYKARQIGLNRLVAIKMILGGAHAGAEESARLRREARAAALLQHPHVIQIHEVGEWAALPYLVLEYAEGGTLAQKLAGSPLSPRQAVELVHTIAQAVEAAHRRGIVHRDLKPANVLLTADGAPKISDFGLAKQLDGEPGQTRSGAILGTPSYMAPEQAGGRIRDIGAHTDVYALGAILYECLTGRPPFRAVNALETLRQVESEEPLPPRRLHGTIPADLETICLKCLHKQPARRYASAAALADDLRRFLTGEPIRARPAGAGERAAKWARRHPLPATLIALSVVAVAALVAGAAGFAVYLQHALDQRTGELRQEQAGRERETRDRQREHDRETQERQYLTDMRAGWQYWRQGETARMRALLLRHQPAAAPSVQLGDDRRGFEWHYLRGQLGRARATLSGHGTALHCAAFSPDGKVLAAGGGDAILRLWDLATGRERSAPLGNGFTVSAVAFTPAGILAAACSDGAVRLWRPEETLPPAVLTGHQGAVDVLAISADGKWLASLDKDAVVRVWDLEARTAKTLNGGETYAANLAFSPDSRTLFTTHPQEYAVRTWDVATGAERLPLRIGVSACNLTLSPDARRMAVGSTWGEVVSWPIHAPWRRVALTAHRGAVGALALSPDGQTLASGGARDGLVRLWDLESRKLKLCFAGHTGGVTGVVFSPDGGILASVGQDGTVKLWERAAQGGGEPLGQALRFDGPFAFAAAGRTLALAACDRSVVLLDPVTGTVRGRLRGHPGAVNALAASPDGRTLATAGADGAIRCWDTDTGWQRLRLAGHRDAAQVVAFAPDGRLLASGGHDGVVRVWQATTGAERNVFPDHPEVVTGVAFTPDGQTLVTACRSGLLQCWDLATGRRLARQQSLPIAALACAPVGRTVATAHRGGLIKLRCAVDLALLADLHSGRAEGVNVLAFAPDGRTLVSGAEDHIVYCWDLKTRALRQHIRWHAGAIRGVGFSPDGATLAVTSAAGEMHLWDTARWTARKPPGQPLRPVWALAFTPDGKTLFTGGMGLTHFGGVRAFTPVRRTFVGGANWDNAVPEDADDVIGWDVASGQRRPSLRGQHGFGVHSLALAAGGRILAGAGPGGKICLWDLGKGTSLPPLFLRPRDDLCWRQWERLHRHGIPCSPEFEDVMGTIAFSPDGRLLATAGAGETIRLWEMPEGRERATLEGKPGKGWSVAFSPDGATLAASAADQVQLWDVVKGRLRQTLPWRGERIRCLTFSPDGTLLAGAADRQVRLWDLAGRRERSPLIGHTDAVAAVAFAPDGKTLASGSWDETVRLWSPATGQDLGMLEGHRGAVHGVAFSPDGRTLASAGECGAKGEVYLWRGARSEWRSQSQPP